MGCMLAVPFPETVQSTDFVGGKLVWYIYWMRGAIQLRAGVLKEFAGIRRLWLFFQLGFAFLHPAFRFTILVAYNPTGCVRTI